MATPTTSTSTATKGYKTSEFWLTLAGNVGAILTTIAGITDAKTAGLLMVIANGLYALSRGFAKQ